MSALDPLREALERIVRDADALNHVEVRAIAQQALNATNPANVRYVPGTGERVQYPDAESASEHHIRVMGAGGFEPYDHEAARDEMYAGLPDQFGEDDDDEQDERYDPDDDRTPDSNPADIERDTP